MAVLLTPPVLQFEDQNGVPLAGGFLYTYAAGTTTPKATFTDYTEAVQAANPVVLDSAGRCTVWISGSYKFVLTDSLGNTIATTDNVTAFNVPAASGSSYFQSFSGNGSTTDFTLSQNLGTDPNAVLVFIYASSAWAPINPNAFTLNGTALNFASAPASGTNNIFVYAPSLLLGAASAAAAAAATSETNAAASAATASTEAGIATTQAGIATTQAGNAASYATSASTSASTATTQAGIATTQAGNAATSATSASTSATNAASSATAAAASAVLAGTALTATSTTSNTIGTGNFTFTIQANKNFFAGQNIIAASNANSANYIHGTVSSYSGTTLVITETDNGGSGSHADWNISVSGTQGTAGPGTGTVTSVGFTGDGTIYNASVTGSPVTTSGTFAPTLHTQTANTVFAGPTSGGAASPTFRSLLTADFPTTSVAAGSYTSTNLTVDSTGRITAASSGTGTSELVLLGTATASTSSTLDFTSLISSSYTQYHMVFENLLQSATASIGLETSTDNGATWTPILYSQLAATALGSTSVPVRTAVNGSTLVLISESKTTTTSNGFADFVTTSSGGFCWESAISDTTYGPNFEQALVSTLSVNGVNAIRILPSAGNFTSGKVYLYGVKNT